MISSNALAQELMITNYGNKENNLKEARELLIRVLSFDIEDCGACYDNGKPNLNYGAFIANRKISEEFLRKIKYE